MARQIAELERKIGQLTMENDFLKKALRHFRAHHPPAVARKAGVQASKHFCPPRGLQHKSCLLVADQNTLSRARVSMSFVSDPVGLVLDSQSAARKKRGAADGWLGVVREAKVVSGAFSPASLRDV